MRKATILFIIIAASLCLFSCKKDNNNVNNDPPVNVPPPITILSKTIEVGDACEHFDYPKCYFAKLKDSSYTIVYNSAYITGSCFNLVNYSKYGILNWHKQFPITYAQCISFDTTADGGYLVYIRWQQQDYPAVDWSSLMKLNHQGDSIWTKNFYKRYYGKTIPLSNGEICLASIKNRKPYVLFLNSTGDSLRSAYIGDTLVSGIYDSYTGIYSLLTPTNDLIFFIEYYVVPNHYNCVIQTDYMGNVMWQKTLPFAVSDVNVNSNGSMLCAAGNIINLSPTADILNTIDVSLGNGPVLKTDDNNYLYGSDKLYKVDASGKILWSQDFLSNLNGHTIQCHKLIDNHDETFTMFGYYGTNYYYTAIAIRFRIG